MKMIKGDANKGMKENRMEVDVCVCVLSMARQWISSRWLIQSSYYHHRLLNFVIHCHLFVA